MNTNLGNRIKNLRNERHLSQEYVAEQIGVSRQSVSKWESGISRPSTGNLICLAELFDVSLDAFTQEAPDNSGNVKKRKDISKTLKIIVCTIFGICILHFIIWAIFYGMYSLKGDVFAEKYICVPNRFFRNRCCMLCVPAYGRGIDVSRNSNRGSDRQVKGNRLSGNYSNMCNAVAPTPAAYVYTHANSVLNARLKALIRRSGQFRPPCGQESGIENRFQPIAPD